MSVAVPLSELREELEERSYSGYLLTVSDGRPHCVAVALSWEGDELSMAAGRTSVRNAAEGRTVALLLPPASGPPTRDAGDGEAGYSLIVDAEVTATAEPHETGGGPSSLRVRPTHAVLHRPAVTPDGSRLHDCVHVYDESATG
jgi:hypothetical protein